MTGDWFLMSVLVWRAMSPGTTLFSREIKVGWPTVKVLYNMSVGVRVLSSFNSPPYPCQLYKGGLKTESPSLNYKCNKVSLKNIRAQIKPPPPKTERLLFETSLDILFVYVIQCLFIYMEYIIMKDYSVVERMVMEQMEKSAKLWFSEKEMSDEEVFALKQKIHRLNEVLTNKERDTDISVR